MKVRLTNLWESLRTSYWLIPALMCVGAALLAFLTQEIDERTSPGANSRLEFFYFGGPDGARSVLSTIAGSMITVAGVTFSITIVALANASSQFGPRLLRNFMKDTGNQIVLGTFLATFLYCLLALRTVRGLEGFQFVPQVSVTVGLALAVLSISVLIFFIHHVARSLHVSNVIAGVGRELEHEVDELFPEALGQSGEEAAPAEGMGLEELQPMATVESTRLGYIVGIEDERLMSITEEYDVTVVLIERPGSFIFPGCPLMGGYAADTSSRELTQQLNNVVLVNAQRTPTQDIEILFDELVEIALRALSPGVNDPQTAITCIHWLSAGFGKLGQRRLPSPYRYSEDGQLRIVASTVSYEVLVRRVFNQLVHAAADNAFVLSALLEALEMMSNVARNGEQFDALVNQAAIVDRASRDRISDDEIRQELQRHYQQLIQRISNIRHPLASSLNSESDTEGVKIA